MNDDKGWRSLLPDGLDNWLKGRSGDGDAPGAEWRPSPDALPAGLSSTVPYEPGVEWEPGPPLETCPACGAAFAEPYVAGIGQFCQHCGVTRSAPAGGTASLDPDAVMAPARPCVSCGGLLDGDGYCTVCGFKAASERDHYREEPAPWVAGVCDRGVKHARNEDAMALAASQEQGERAVLVVCDGVSSSTDSDVAALAGAEAARDLLWANQPQGIGVEASRTAAMERALTEAAVAANEAVIEKTDPASQNAASATFVAAVVSKGRLFFANLGDSRAYWLPDEGEPVQLTRDDSVAEARIELGVSRAEAENGPGAHAITKWLGRDAPEIDPRCGELEVGDGWALVCSDGLWNYASTPQEIRTVLDAALDSAPAGLVDICEHMVAWANAQGGHDNITVSLARLGALPAAAVPTPSSATEPDFTSAEAVPELGAPQAAPPAAPAEDAPPSITDGQVVEGQPA